MEAKHFVLTRERKGSRGERERLGRTDHGRGRGEGENNGRRGEEGSSRVKKGGVKSWFGNHRLRVYGKEGNTCKKLRRVGMDVIDDEG